MRAPGGTGGHTTNAQRPAAFNDLCHQPYSCLSPCTFPFPPLAPLPFSPPLPAFSPPALGQARASAPPPVGPPRVRPRPGPSHQAAAPLPAPITAYECHHTVAEAGEGKSFPPRFDGHQVRAGVDSVLLIFCGLASWVALRGWAPCGLCAKCAEIVMDSSGTTCALASTSQLCGVSWLVRPRGVSAPSAPTLASQAMARCIGSPITGWFLQRSSNTRHHSV